MWQDGNGEQMAISKLTPEIINAAIAGFEQQKKQIDSSIADLRAVLNNGSAPHATASEAPVRKRRKMSAAARKRIGDATRARWAKYRAGLERPVPARKPKRKLSAAA